MGNKKIEKYEASISKRGSKGEKIDFELIAYIKSCLEENNIEKARKVNNIIDWFFINKYGYKFSLNDFEGIGGLFLCLNLALCIFLIW